ncbi:MAG: DNA recombination protein RmuC [Alphaproteobacteria bacterium]
MAGFEVVNLVGMGVFAGVAVAVALLLTVPALRRARKEIARLEAETVGMKERGDRAEQRVPGMEGEIRELNKKLNDESRRAENLNGQLEAERKSHEAKLVELRKMGEEIERKFGALAQKALSGNAETFLKLVSERFEKHQAAAGEDLGKRQAAIENMLKPIAENLQKFERQVGEIEKAREGAYSAIQTQVRSLTEGQTALRGETGRLVQALRTPKTRGRWGEFQLRQVFEMAGMVEHVDYFNEHHIATDEGRLRPDAVVKLPGGKSIVVDAKTPLDGYLSAVEADNETDRNAALERHVRQVRAHVANLSRKEYWNALDETPDFVVMFVPGEAIYSAAIERAPDLFEEAIRNRVLISTPTTLIALIKAIAYGWQQEKMAKNAQEVATLARDLYDRIKIFGGHMDALGKSLRQSVERYNKGVGSLEGRVLPQARKFEQLGVIASADDLAKLDGIDLEPRELTAPEFSGTTK